jgi:hypothetical protein
LSRTRFDASYISFPTPALGLSSGRPPDSLPLRNHHLPRPRRTRSPTHFFSNQGLHGPVSSATQIRREKAPYPAVKSFKPGSSSRVPHLGHSGRSYLSILPEVCHHFRPAFSLSLLPLLPLRHLSGSSSLPPNRAISSPKLSLSFSLPFKLSSSGAYESRQPRRGHDVYLSSSFI